MKKFDENKNNDGIEEVGGEIYFNPILALLERKNVIAKRLAKTSSTVKFCIVCNTFYKPKFIRKEDAPEGSIGREQWMSGVCSDKCWDKIFEKKGSDNLCHANLNAPIAEQQWKSWMMTHIIRTTAIIAAIIIERR